MKIIYFKLNFELNSRKITLLKNIIDAGKVKLVTY